jgi:hypothetical protein
MEKLYNRVTYKDILSDEDVRGGSGMTDSNNVRHSGHREYVESKLWQCPSSPNVAPGQKIGAHHWIEIHGKPGLFKCKFCGKVTRFDYRHYANELAEKSSSN